MAHIRIYDLRLFFQTDIPNIPSRAGFRVDWAEDNFIDVNILSPIIFWHLFLRTVIDFLILNPHFDFLYTCQQFDAVILIFFTFQIENRGLPSFLLRAPVKIWNLNQENLAFKAHSVIYRFKFFQFSNIMPSHYRLVGIM